MEKPTPLNEEYIFDKGLIISSTNLQGIITYANKKFCEVAGYSKDELIGHNHSLIRHPDMPKVSFKDLWDTITAAKEWTGVVKNLRKDGKYYWVYTHISPISSHGKIVGYSAARRPASENEIIEIIPIYKNMKAEENDY